MCFWVALKDSVAYYCSRGGNNWLLANSSSPCGVAYYVSSRKGCMEKLSQVVRAAFSDTWTVRATDTQRLPCLADIVGTSAGP